MIKDENTLVELGKEEVDIINYSFDKAVKFEGESYTKILINLEGLTGKDIKEISNNLLAQGEVLGLAETNKNFLAALAARAANVADEFMDCIPAKDFSKITIQVQNFLLG